MSKALRLLHVGSGNGKLSPSIMGLLPDYQEVKLDICKEYNPDIVANMTNMGDIGEYDALVSCHSLEHLHPEDVDKALKEFLRVLCPKGVALIYVPDLEDVKPDDEIVYESAAGPITGHDMYFGYAPYVADNPYMAHHSGFTEDRLMKVMNRVGFSKVIVQRVFFMQLLAIGVK